MSEVIAKNLNKGAKAGKRRAVPRKRLRHYGRCHKGGKSDNIIVPAVKLPQKAAINK